jgi:dihydropteroate synthase-like protein
MNFAERCKNKHVMFVTGKLAQSAVREIVASLGQKYEFTYQVTVLPITVAALMTTKWIGRHLQVDRSFDFVVVPGYLQDELAQLQSMIESEIVVGPKDIRDLSMLFNQAPVHSDYGDYRIEIIAEINYAARLDRQTLLDQASQLKASGANIIDLGCEPGKQWRDVGDAVRMLREKGLRCSIDSFDTWEVSTAVESGAELVLSVNEFNCDAACQWGAEVVVIPSPDDDWLDSIRRTVAVLEKNQVKYRIDPILDPIGCGFMNSLVRYQKVREEFPESEMMMGIGNITELTDVDSAGVNVILLAMCEELRINSVLTTQVINWARSSVAECDIARRLVHHAQIHAIPPKRLDTRLVMLRDTRLKNYSSESIDALASGIRDNNYRILVDQTMIHIVSANIHVQGTDPFAIMEELMLKPESKNIDPSHAFYLGFELSKAATALQLGKQYEQDVALNWGMLTIDEKHHRLKRSPKRQGH